jgi:hypothetical protein
MNDIFVSRHFPASSHLVSNLQTVLFLTYSCLKPLPQEISILTLCRLLFCLTRVFSKQKIFFFGSNRNKPKLNLFRLIFGLFRETKKFLFRFVSVFLTRFETTETTETNRSVSKLTKKNKKSNIKTRVSTKQTKKIFLFELKQSKTHLFRLIFSLVRETKKKFGFRSFWCFESVSKQPKEPIQTDRFRNKSKKLIKQNLKLNLKLIFS